MAQFASAAFTGADGTDLVTHDSSWTKINSTTGDAKLISNRLRWSSNTASAGYYHSGSPASADYTVAADAYMPSGGAGTIAPTVAGRISTSANTLYMYRVNYVTDGQKTQLFKIVSGTATQLGSNSSNKTVSQGNSYGLKLEMVGTAIKGYWNGSTSADLSATDSAITAAGKSGLRFSGSGTLSDTVGWQLDNFSADDAGGTSYTLTASAGSFTQTGTAASLLYGRWVAADAGTFLLGGVSATFPRGYSLAADGGTFALTGGDVAMPRGRSMAADAGSFTLTGADATFPRGSSLTAESGTFALTGEEAFFRWARVLAADGGSFSLSGGALQTEEEQAPVKGGGGAYRRVSPWVQARKRVALQRMLAVLIEEEPKPETKKLIRAIKAGKPIENEDKKPPVVMSEISAEKIAASLIPERVAVIEQAIAGGLDVQRVILKAIELARERDDEDVLMLL